MKTFSVRSLRAEGSGLGPKRERVVLISPASNAYNPYSPGRSRTYPKLSASDLRLVQSKPRTFVPRVKKLRIPSYFFAGNLR